MDEYNFEETLEMAGYTPYETLITLFPGTDLTAEMSNYFTTDELVDFLEYVFNSLDIDVSDF